MRGWLSRLAVAFCVTLVTLPVHAENYAFLVAVQDYDVKDLKPLQFTRNDILEFAELLKQAGFSERNIVVMIDKTENRRFMAEAEKIRKQFDLLLAGLEPNDSLIVAFSGHGVQFEGDEKNYYCPADADLDDPKRVRLIPINEIYERLKQCPAERKLLLVDACRNDPLSTIKKARQSVKLKSVTRPQTEPIPKGIVALFSCAAGQESYEWPDLKHGVFFHHVLKGWKGEASKGGQQLTLDELVAYAKLETQTFARQTINAPQTPQLKSDFEGTWVLRQYSKAPEKVKVTSKPTTPRKSGEVASIVPARKTPEHAGDQQFATAAEIRRALGVLKNSPVKISEKINILVWVGGPLTKQNVQDLQKLSRNDVAVTTVCTSFDDTQTELFSSIRGRDSWAIIADGRKGLELRDVDAVVFVGFLNQNEARGLAPLPEKAPAQTALSLYTIWSIEAGKHVLVLSDRENWKAVDMWKARPKWSPFDQLRMRRLLCWRASQPGANDVAAFVKAVTTGSLGGAGSLRAD